MGVFFFSSYGFANWMASRHAHVPAIVFGWEHWIPFLPWTIIPYWSIDLFYIGSFFLCASRRELDRHVLRLLTAQVIAVTCFLLWPLHFSFDRPETQGVFGWLFAVLMGFDKPYNQAPSLHIALLVVLWVLYSRHIRGAWRWLVHGWSVLIGLSVLTTFQHHFFDVPTGLLLGWLCVWLWPDCSRPMWQTWQLTRNRRRLRLAVCYLFGALLMILAALGSHGAALWLAWPATALLLVALAYIGWDTNMFQKRPGGHLSLAARWLLAPYLLGAWCNSRWWTRHAPEPVQITPDIWLGRMPTDRLPTAHCAVVDTCAELSCAVESRAYTSIPMLDLVPPAPAQLRATAEAIERSRRQGPVLVCCALGFSRSAASIATWLVRSGRATSVDDAISIIGKARPSIVLSATHRRSIVQATTAPAAPGNPSRVSTA